MSMFLCLVRPDGAPISEGVRKRYERKREAHTHLPRQWHLHGEFAVLTGSDVPGLAPTIARAAGWIGVGIVRLDNRAEVAQWAELPNSGASDLELILGAIEQCGTDVIAQVLGDFAFVGWHPTTRTLLAARDTFGVRRLYMARRGGLFAFCTRAAPLAEHSEAYNLEYFAEYLVNGPVEHMTAFTGVEPVRSAEVVVVHDGALRRDRYWPPDGLIADMLSADEAPTHEDPVAMCRALLLEAVRVRLTGCPDVWSHLSGGMDSSSVVAAAQVLAADGVGPGLAGAITYATTPPVGSDVQHATTVARHYGLRHVLIGDWWLWQDDGHGPPLLDQPSTAQVNYALERRLTALIHEAGGRVLLTGIGADLYLRPNLTSPADLLASGRIAAAFRETTRFAIAMRQSVWSVGLRHAAYPLLPKRLRQRFARQAWRVPDWITPSFARQYELASRTEATRSYAGAAGAKVARNQIYRLLTVGASLPHERIGEPNHDSRHPLLHRPLVEFGLRLPPEWLFVPRASKRVLREATRGLLPESVRTRQGKGGHPPQVAKAIALERAHLHELARRSRLAARGCLIPDRLVRMIDTAHEQSSEHVAAVVRTLALEVWLEQREVSVAKCS